MTLWLQPRRVRLVSARHWKSAIAIGAEAELEAARNILDVLGGDTPRGALNEIFQPAA